MVKNGDISRNDADSILDTLDSADDGALNSLAHQFSGYKTNDDLLSYLKHLFDLESLTKSEKANLLQQQNAALQQLSVQVQRKKQQQDELAQARRGLNAYTPADLKLALEEENPRIREDRAGNLIGVIRLRNGDRLTFLMSKKNFAKRWVTDPERKLARPVDMFLGRYSGGIYKTDDDVFKAHEGIANGPLTAATIVYDALDYIPLFDTAKLLEQALRLWDTNPEAAKKLLLDAGISFAGDIITVGPGIYKLGDKAARTMRKTERLQFAGGEAKIVASEANPNWGWKAQTKEEKAKAEGLLNELRTNGAKLPRSSKTYNREGAEIYRKLKDEELLLLAEKYGGEVHLLTLEKGGKTEYRLFRAETGDPLHVGPSPEWLEQNGYKVLDATHVHPTTWKGKTGGSHIRSGEDEDWAKAILGQQKAGFEQRIVTRNDQGGFLHGEWEIGK